jgi:hypothetical protein
MTADAGLPVRVWVADVWDTLNLDAEPDWTVQTLKRTALERGTARSLDPSDYQVKYRGGLISDEAATLAALGVPAGGAFVVLRSRRVPAR